MTANVILLGTCDTKLEELLFLRGEILRTIAVTVTLIDVGRDEVEHDAINIQRSQLQRDYGESSNIHDLPRNKVIQEMANCATQVVKKLHNEGWIHGIISAGGSGGTSLASAVMRDALPIGFPKMIVSTVASGDVGPLVQETDITMMYSVVDIAGLNQILRRILSNAAAAISAMALSYASRSPSQTYGSKKRVGITVFGVTTPAVDVIRKHLESNYNIECYIFHATGHGGKSMERLVRDGSLDAVLDLTTTEICDFLTGGNMSAGPQRLEAAAELGIPNIISLGATDMTNFGPRNTVPERYKDRRLYEHNSIVTLMRSSARECRQVGEFIVGKLKDHAKDLRMIEVWMPVGGVSMISTPGAVYADSDADAELFRAVKQGLTGAGIAVVEDQRAINDPGFARDIADALVRRMGIKNVES